jgi:putative tryptophan/tyrosine transport system substrate-binding protein
MSNAFERAVVVVAFLLVTVSSLVAEAQQAGKIYRVGSLGPGPPGCTFPPVKIAKGTPWDGQPLHPYEVAVRLGLRDGGWVEGQNFLFERRCYQSLGQLQPFAGDLARRDLDAVIVWTLPAAQALKQAIKGTPIVFIALPDPVEDGLIASFQRPGGNLTGTVSQADELYAKRAELMREVLPQAKTLAYLYENVASETKAAVLLQAAGERLGFTVRRFPIDRPDQIAAAFLAMRAESPDFLTVGIGGMLWVERTSIIQSATDQGLPITCPFAEFVELGCLMSYAPSWFQMSRRAAVYLDKVLRGADAAELAAERPTQFELVINLKTATQLGVQIPPSILARADRLID